MVLQDLSPQVRFLQLSLVITYPFCIMSKATLLVWVVGSPPHVNTSYLQLDVDYRDYELGLNV